jgi:hypothetical protein
MIPKYAVIIGAMKSGTTSLYNYLAQHPQVAACALKEPNFFARDDHWERGLEWYEGLWDFDPQKHRIALEATANYSKAPFTPSAAARMSQISGQFTLIYIMRHPIERLESHLTHGTAVGWMRPDRPIQEYRQAIGVSKYATQLNDYRQYFPVSDMLLIDFSELRNRPEELTRRIFEALKLDPDVPIEVNEVHNRSSERRREHPLWLALRNLKVLEQLATRIIPRPIRAGIRRLISQEPRRVRLSPQDRAYVTDQIREDIACLERDYDFDTSGWNL